GQILHQIDRITIPPESISKQEGMISANGAGGSRRMQVIESQGRMVRTVDAMLGIIGSSIICAIDDRLIFVSRRLAGVDAGLIYQYDADWHRAIDRTFIELTSIGD